MAACSLLKGSYVDASCCPLFPPDFSSLFCAPFSPQQVGSQVVEVAREEALSLTRVLLSSQPEETRTGTFYDLREVTDERGNRLCPFSFASTLPHHPVYRMPNCTDVEALLSYVLCPTPSSLSLLPPSSASLYAAGDGRNLLTNAPRTPPPSSFVDATSERQAFEMGEAYALSLLRDCPLDGVGTGFGGDCAERSANATAFLNSFESRPFDFDGSTLGRWDPSRFPDDGKGGLRVSQLLHASFQNGARRVEVEGRRVREEEDATPLWTRAGLLAEEEGSASSSPPVVRKAASSHVGTGRGLGTIVHSEPLYSHYLDAALACWERLTSVFSAPPLDRARDSADSSSAVLTSLNGGFDDLLSSVAEVARNALAESYRAKYLVGMKIRPAQLASRIDLHFSPDLGASDLGPDVSTLVDHFFDASGGAKEVRKEWMQAYSQRSSSSTGEANVLLATQYPTSRHPSWTHGHATVAGACVTVLKALLRLHHDEDGAQVGWPESEGTWRADGPSLSPAVPTERLSFVSELDKLAYNVALGRNYAGQHFRTEAEVSLEFGQEVALSFLRQRACEDGAAGARPPLRVDLFNHTRLLVSGCSVPDQEAAYVGPRLSPPSPPSPPSPLSPLSPLSPPPPLSPFSPVPLTSDLGLTGNVSSFWRLSPKPTLNVQFSVVQPSGVRYVRLVQRSMSYGDSTTKRAQLRVVNSTGHVARYSVRFGPPSGGYYFATFGLWMQDEGRDMLPGWTGTCLTTHALDAYGRTCASTFSGEEAVLDPAHVEVDLGAPTQIVRLEYEVRDAYPYLPPASLAAREYGGRGYDGGVGKTGGGERTKPSPATDQFYEEGTWDVGLVRLSLHKADGSLLPSGEILLQSGDAYDNSNPSSSSSNSEEERALNPLLHPYRSSSCVFDHSNTFPPLFGLESSTDPSIAPHYYPSSLVDAHCADDDDNYYLKRRTSGPLAGSSAWPCTLSDDASDPIDCSNVPVPKSWAFPGYAVRDGLRSTSFSLFSVASSSSFDRLFPKPFLEIQLPSPTRVAKIGVRQRHMAFGDATMRRALLLDGDTGAQVGEVDFGVPLPNCSTGTCWTSPSSSDDYGTNGRAAEVTASLPPGTDLRRLRVEVAQVNDYVPPSHLASPLSWHRVKPFDLGSDWTQDKHEIIDVAVRAEIESRGMSTNRTWVEFTPAEWQALGQPPVVDANAFVRVAWKADLTGAGTGTRYYLPRPHVLESHDHDNWGVSGVELSHPVFHDYVFETSGSWNFGFSSITLYGEDDAPIDASIVANSTFFDDSKSLSSDYGPDKPFQYAYDPSLRSLTDEQASDRTLPSWLWHGRGVLRGEVGGYSLLGPSSPPSPPSSPATSEDDDDDDVVPNPEPTGG